MTKHIAILRGDGIGPEIVAETVRVLDKLIAQGLDASYEYAPLGGEAYDEYGHPYPEFTQNLCRKADAVLLGAVGSPQYDNLDRPLRPERGLLAIRKDLNLFANLRPAILYPELANASTLKPEIVAGRPFDYGLLSELEGLANRGYTSGFLERHQTQDYQNYLSGHSTAKQSQYVGHVTEIDAEGWATIEVKNRFAIGDSLEIIHPSGNQTIKLEQMTRKGQPVDVAPGNGIQVKIPDMQDKEKALIARVLNP